MISFMISVVPPKIEVDTVEPPELTVAPENSGVVLPPVKAGLSLVSASHGVRAVRAGPSVITRQRIVSPRRNSPSRGVAPTTTPNQRPRISSRQGEHGRGRPHVPGLRPPDHVDPQPQVHAGPGGATGPPGPAIASGWPG